MNTRTMTIALLLLSFLWSCRPDRAELQRPMAGARITSVRFAEGTDSFAYNADGSLQRHLHYDHLGQLLLDQQYSYSGGRPTRCLISGGGRADYFYPAADSIRIEVSDAAGAPTWTLRYRVTGNRVLEAQEFLRNASGIQARGRRVYTYNGAGDVTRIDHYDGHSGQWALEGRTHVLQYDQHPNSTAATDGFPYFLGIDAPIQHNPQHEEYRLPNGSLYRTVLRQYQYNLAGHKQQAQKTISSLHEPTQTLAVEYRY